MIVSITTSTARVVHVAPDNEPVFNHSEVMQMKGMNPEEAELIAMVKEVFPGSNVAEVQHHQPKNEEASQMALLDYDPNEVPPASDFEALPEGDHLLVITEEEIAGNKAGTGKNLVLSVQVIEGQFKDMTEKIWLAIHNPNDIAQTIARQKVEQIKAAVGKPNSLDSGDLLNIPFIGHKAKNKKGEVEYKKFSPANGAAPKTAARTPTGAKRPWEK